VETLSIESRIHGALQGNAGRRRGLERADFTDESSVVVERARRGRGCGRGIHRVAGRTTTGFRRRFSAGSHTKLNAARGPRMAKPTLRRASTFGSCCARSRGGCGGPAEEARSPHSSGLRREGAVVGPQVTGIHSAAAVPGPENAARAFIDQRRVETGHEGRAVPAELASTVSTQPY